MGRKVILLLFVGILAAGAIVRAKTTTPLLVHPTAEQIRQAEEYAEECLRGYEERHGKIEAEPENMLPVELSNFVDGKIIQGYTVEEQILIEERKQTAILQKILGIMEGGR